MAGYAGFSMSNNAVAAYNYGEKPLSKWTKTELVEAIEACIVENDHTLSITLVKKAPVTLLKSMFLDQSSWHHTSIHFNRTDFYSLNEDAVLEATDEKILESIAEHKAAKKEEAAPEVEKCECEFLEWSGSRKHPKATVCVETGEIKGSWFYRKDGSKKSINANGFKILRRL